ncbi:MAG: hypothetical protein ACERKZ_21140 [Lachnotalea sp.]
MYNIKYYKINQIIATGLCPLLLMSTLVSILSVNGTNPLTIANIIALILFVGVCQLLYVANSIVKPIRETENCIVQLSEGNLDILIDEKMRKRKYEIGAMSESLLVLREKLKDTILDIRNVSKKLVSSEDIMKKMVEEASAVTGQIESAIQIISDDAKL